ncbi:MAG: amino acid dehydrogenase [Gemmatales bacterium]|nr:MAG: amino acid dehydrogenase [Gemmatales bacterium]
MSHIVIVGGGVIGAACAYYLSVAGCKVTIVEQGEFGKGCSHGNCGFICPSHVLPLTMPGAVKAALKSLFLKDSPFRIKPRLDLALWSWLWNFARRCNERDMMLAAAAIQPLLNSSRDLYDELMQLAGMDCEWQTRGMLFVLQTRSAFIHYEKTTDLLRDQFQLRFRKLVGEELTAFEPALKAGLAGGWHFDTDAHLRPDKLLSSWKRILQSRGVAIRENCRVIGFAGQLATARTARTTEGDIAGDGFVVAAGALTPFLNQALGCRIPIQPGKGYSITMPRPQRCPQVPMVFEEHRVAVTPMLSGYRLGSTMEFAGYDATLDRRRLAILTNGARHYLHEPTCEPVEEEWFGWRPMTYDSVPIIDASPAWRNVWIAAGHNMLGLSMAPATGRLICELITGVTPHIDPKPYSLQRFVR